MSAPREQLFRPRVSACVRPILGLVIVACSLCLTQCAQIDSNPVELHKNSNNNNNNNNDHHSEQQPRQSTISQASTTASTHSVRERAAPLAAARDAAASAPKSVPAHEAEPATDSIAALADSNFLDSQQSGKQQQQHQSPDEISDTNSLHSFKSSLSKTRRQAEQQIKSADWWTKLAHKRKRLNPDNERRIDGNKSASKGASNTGTVYREQPLSQNALVTIRHQLMAIRDKHRLLMQKSVPQLIQLDQKLVDSYRLCLRRKMPLYAGLLYRTRDYVVRMANEVRFERRALEAMTKQIQKVLRHKMTNRTLVKDFNRQSATNANLTSGGNSNLSTLELYALKPLQQLLDYELASGSSPATGDSLHGAGDAAAGARRARRAASSSGALSSPPSAPSQVRKALTGKLENSQQPLDGQQQQPVYQVLLVPGSLQQRTRQSSLSQQAKTRFASEVPEEENQLTFVGQNEPSDNENFDLSTTSSATSTTSTTTTTKRPRPKSYAVHINEVNLKRELIKTQALIDRINASSHELTSVADDIIYLFKLSVGDVGPRAKGLTASGKINRFELLSADPKRTKKMMLKSPFKVLLERYGKLTMTKPGGNSQTTGTVTATTSSDLASMRSTVTNEINMTTGSLLDMNSSNNPPEMVPLFDPAEIVTYRDPIDLELGFDAPATLEI